MEAPRRPTEPFVEVSKVLVVVVAVLHADVVLGVVGVVDVGAAPRGGGRGRAHGSSARVLFSCRLELFKMHFSLQLQFAKIRQQAPDWQKLLLLRSSVKCARMNYDGDQVFAVVDVVSRVVRRNDGGGKTAAPCIDSASEVQPKRTPAASKNWHSTLSYIRQCSRLPSPQLAKFPMLLRIGLDSSVLEMPFFRTQRSRT